MCQHRVRRSVGEEQPIKASNDRGAWAPEKRSSASARLPSYVKKRFLVVGNGQPAGALVETLIATDQGDLAALLTSEPNGRAVSQLPKGLAPIYPEETIRDVVQLEKLDLLSCDWLLCANTTYIVPKEVLTSFAARALNFHPGLLPAYAGLHAHQWAIRNGEAEFGVTVHMIEAGLDTGDVVAVRRFVIRPEDTGLSLYRNCIRAGSQLFTEVLRRILTEEDPLPRNPQDLSKRRLYRHAEAIDGRIDWTMPAQRVVDFIRAGNYYPFSSPTYTPQINDFGPPSVHVLRAVVAGDSGAPGRLIDVRPTGPVIGCGDGGAVVLQRATRDGREVDGSAWRQLFECLPPPAILALGLRVKGRL